MAFPAVVSENSSAESAGDVTTHTVSLPASLVSGNLIIIAVVIDGNSGTVTAPSGFTDIVTAFPNQVGSNIVHGAMWWKISDGLEGSTITFATVNGQRSAHKSWQISGHDSGQAPEGSGIGDDGTPSANPDPPNISPTGGAKDYLWLVIGGKDTGDSTFSGWPTNYSGTGESGMSGAAAAGCCIGWARRELNAASENPGTFTIGESEQWVAMTAAVHPAAVVAPSLVLPLTFPLTNTKLRM